MTCRHRAHQIRINPYSDLNQTVRTVPAEIDIRIAFNNSPSFHLQDENFHLHAVRIVL